MQIVNECKDYCCCKCKLWMNVRLVNGCDNCYGSKWMQFVNGCKM